MLKGIGKNYDFIMADPPWYFKNFSKKGEVKNPVSHYDCMSLDQIKEMQVSSLASKNCILWLWATWPMLPQAFDVMESWGFTYKTGGDWHKMTKNGKQAFGTGYILRSASEPFLIGTIGKPKTTNSCRTSIEAKTREHSRKPEEAFAMAEKLMPDAKRLELFSRQKRNYWDSWGNEVDNFEELEGAK